MHAKEYFSDVKAGEILGIAGVADNGQEELFNLISGEDTSAAGTVFFAKNGLINTRKAEAFCTSIIEKLNVKATGIHAQAKSLSGGNLQKYIIGREILQNPKLLVCSHPIWGVDIGAAILVVSEDIDELYSISDRICGGKLSPVAATKNVSINQLGMWMTGKFYASSDSLNASEQGGNIPESNIQKDRGGMKSC